MNQWYLIQFKPNSHRLAERNLLRQGFETFLPMQKITRRKASRFVSDLKPLFPGYMFVSVNSDLAPWRTINNTIGVSKLVSFEGKPKPLPLTVDFWFDAEMRCLWHTASTQKSERGR